MGRGLRSMFPRSVGTLKGSVQQFALPRGAAGYAMELGPEVLFAGLAGKYALDTGGGAGEAALIGAEDLALGAGGSIGGRAAGAALGFMLGGPRGAVTGANAGGWIGGFGLPMFGPRPMHGKMQKRLEEQYAAEQLAREQGIFAQGMQAAGQHVSQLPSVGGLDNSLNSLMAMYGYGG